MRQKRNIFSTLAVIIAVFGLTTAATAAGKGGLTIQVEGLRNNKGEVLVALSPETASANTSPEDMLKMSVATGKKKSSKNGVSFVLNNIPDGTYYIYIIHDENGNEELDYTKQFPEEGFASYPGKSGIPQVRIAGEDTEAKVVMVYLNDLVKKMK